MAQLALIGPIISGVVGLAGTVLSAGAAMAQGKAQQDAANYQAKVAGIRAEESRAAAQRDMLERRRKATLTQSTLQARAAASGAGATDPNVQKLGEDIAGQGEFGALMTMYNGESRARGFEDQAAGARFSGEAAAKGGQYAAMGNILSGIGGFANSMGDASAAYKKAYG